jgi:DNA-binding transcriptional regulator YhcF (GntR family)
MEKSPRFNSEDWDLLQVLAKEGFKPTVPIDQQIASHLRQLLHKQEIPAHTKFPSVRKLAGLWGTSSHTIYDALNRLSGEGLVVLRPRQGSFVAPPRRVLRRLCLYHHFSPKNLESSFYFYIFLDIFLTNSLTKRGVVVVPYYDRRDLKKLHTVPAEIRHMASEGEIDALIATTIFPQDTPWLFRLEVPVASLMFGQPERKIEIDLTQLASKVVEIAVQKQRKTIGLINNWSLLDEQNRKTDYLRDELGRLAAPHGISVIYPKKLTEFQSTFYMNCVQLGGELCENLLTAPTPPDMIFVYPDAYVLGVAGALKDRIPVPEKILLVSHRNAETDIYVPFPMTWITVRISDFADALIDQIDRQIAGDKLTPTTIELKIQETAPFQAPR